MPDQPLAPKRTGGPKTSAGKAASARNALKHGLRGGHPVDGREQQAMAVQVAQLTTHYRPQSPLEHLQIQRIARCAAKLDTLYAIEQAKTALALIQSQVTDDQSMAQFAHYPASARHLALKMMQQAEAAPPFDLTDDVLDQICHEIDAFTGVLETESDLSAAFPRLGKFLQSAVIEGYDGPFSVDHRLWAVARLLMTYMSTTLDDLPHMPDTASGRVDQLFLKIHRDLHFKGSIRLGVRPPGGVVAYQTLVRDDFNVFKQLHHCRRQAGEITARFQEVKALVAASTMMPGEDADRLMRYQTTLEKQLSRYIGELLQLQSLAPTR